MTPPMWVWRAPPGWPEPPVGWSPPPGWYPPPGWPPPVNWQYWVSVPGPGVPPPLPVTLATPARSSIVWETRFVMLAFLLPGISSAVLVLVRHVQGVGNANDLTSTVPGHPLSNLILTVLTYFSVAAIVPVVLLLLVRTGQPPTALGLGVPRWRADIWPGLGLAAASWGSEFALLIVFAGLFAQHSKLVNPTMTGHVPVYYVVLAVTTSITTALAEEVIVNGYLLTRLEQLGWSPRRALVLSITLRTSYHIYYGIGFLLTVPFGYFVTRSFQKHRRLNRAVAAHFIFDAVLLTISILTS